MPKTQTGQEYSEATPDKLRAFEYFMGYHAGVSKHILNRNRRYSGYAYIDLNCGAGYQPEYREFGDRAYGSPIIATRQALNHQLDPLLYFVDVRTEAIKALRKSILHKFANLPYFALASDNALFVPKLIEYLPMGDLLGLIYLDPNGNQELPLKALQKFYGNRTFSSIDVLMNLSATNLKRWFNNPKAKGRWGEYGLQEIIDSVPKKHWFIRYPVNKLFKWTFLYGTNWAKQKDLNQIHLYNIESESGQAILRHLLDCQNNPLPIIGQQQCKQLSLPIH